jgi:hypothetical protein
VKVTDSKVTKLEDAGFKAFKQAERAKANAHAARVRAARTQGRKALRERQLAHRQSPSPMSIPNRATVREPAIRPRA